MTWCLCTGVVTNASTADMTVFDVDASRYPAPPTNGSSGAHAGARRRFLDLHQEDREHGEDGDERQEDRGVPRPRVVRHVVLRSNDPRCVVAGLLLGRLRGAGSCNIRKR